MGLKDAKNTENGKNVQDMGDTNHIKREESAEITENINSAESTKNAENINHAQNTEYAESVQNAKNRSSAGIAEHAESVKQKKLYGRPEWYLVGILLAAGWLYGNLLFPSALWKGCDSNALFCIFHLFCVGAGLFYVSCKKMLVPRQSWLYLGFLLVSLVWFFWFSDNKMYLSMMLFLFSMCIYWVVALFGKQSGNQLDERAVGDWLNAVFVVPFVNFFQNFLCLRALWKYGIQGFRKKKEKHTKGLGEAVFGGILAVPVLVIVVPLLMAADQDFQGAMMGMLDWFLNIDLFYIGIETWLRWFVVLFVWCYLFGLFYGTMRAEKRAKAVLGLPVRMLEGFLAVIVMVYLFFFLVKFIGIRGSLGRIKQGELWVSTYARDGFFELCWIAAINFCVFVFAKWGSIQVSRHIKTFLCALGVETIAFVGLAFSKMHLYVATYGWTFKRLYASWFMMLLLVTFVLLLGQLWKKYNAVRIAVLYGCVTFLMLAFGHPYWC